MKFKLEKPYAERHNLRYIPSNFRTAKQTERLSTPTFAIVVFSESVRCFIVDQLKVYMSAMFKNRSSKNSTPSVAIYATYLAISERRSRQNVCRRPLSP